MLEYRRLDRILDIVAGATFTPVAQLSSILGVTDRTLRGDVATLNATLEKNGARVELKRRAGYHLVVSDREAFDAFLATREQGGEPNVLATTDGRFRLLLKYILESTGFVTAEELARKIAVGDSAIQAYIRQAREVLDRYGVELVSKRGMGFRIFGREEARRDCFANEVVNRRYRSYATGFTANEQILFDQVDLYELDDIIGECLEGSSVRANDYGLKNIKVHFALMVTRVKSGSIIEAAPEVDYPEELRSFADDVCDRIQDGLGVHVPEAERAYICRHLVTNAKVPGGQVDADWLNERIDALLQVILADYGYDLRDDLTLRRGLFSHLSSIFRAIDIGNPVRNPLLNTIKLSLPLNFEIALMATSKVFDEPPLVLDEDNVGYLALHIGAAIERRSKGQSAALQALVVCSFGDAAASSLQARLVTLFSRSLSVIATVSHQDYLDLPEHFFEDVSLVVSTVPLKDCPKPTVMVDFSLPPSDVKGVSRLVQYLMEDDNFNKVRRFFSPGAFRVVTEETGKEPLLREMCAQLVSEGAADEGFFSSTMEREAVADTSLNEVFAIPHTMRPEALRTMVSVAILKRPLAWAPGHDAVQIVFLLAVRPGDRLEMEHLYDLLVRIVEDRHLQQELIGVTSYERFLEVLSGAV